MLGQVSSDKAKQGEVRPGQYRLGYAC